MRLLHLLFFLFLFPFASEAQTCYQQLGGYKGIAIEHNGDLLENKSCDLVSVFPPEFQGAFTVFDIDFYHLSKYTEGGFNASWDRALTASELGPFYLIFGRGSTDDNEIKVDLRLPKTGRFECLDLISSELRNSIKSELEIILINSKREDFATREVLVIERLKEIISNITHCCDPNLKAGTNCSACSLLESQTESGAVRLHKKLDKYGFAFELVSNIDDPEYGDPVTKLRSSSKKDIVYSNKCDCRF